MSDARNGTLDVIPRGTPLICTACRMISGFIREDIPPGEAISISRVEFVPGQTPSSGDAFACRLCAAPFMHPIKAAMYVLKRDGIDLQRVETILIRDGRVVGIDLR